MQFEKLIKELRLELGKPLPGISFQMIMSSLHRIREMMNLPDPLNPVPSSVLILLYPDQGSIRFVLILRPEYNGVHSGQISLPGGRFESDDDGFKATALRESKEEVGVDPSKVIVIGKLTELYIPPSNYIVHPFVGFTNEKPVFKKDPKEVEKILEINLNDLLDDKNKKKRNISVRGLHFFTPCYEIEGNIIWGATAMILSEFREIVLQCRKSIKKEEEEGYLPG
ncbi:MAG: CoA pyrophosphatase [Bacteroidota bacterium]|nr:CoA pyrophosphatase [Bacteroidota bacterium]